MKHTLAVIGAIVLIFVLSACNVVSGNGNVVTEEVDVSNFNKIDFSGFGDVYVTVGESESLSIRTDENLQNLIEVTVRGDTLHIGHRDNTNIINSTELVITITVPELEAFELSGAGSVHIEGIDGDRFRVDSSGASEIHLEDIDVNELHVDISGVGSVHVDGHADDLNVSISGAGEFNGYDLESETANIDISGAGSAKVNVSDELTGDISGAGEVSYRGNPSVNVEQSGVGSVNSES